MGATFARREIPKESQRLEGGGCGKLFSGVRFRVRSFSFHAAAWPSACASITPPDADTMRQASHTFATHPNAQRFLRVGVPVLRRGKV